MSDAEAKRQEAVLKAAAEKAELEAEKQAAIEAKAAAKKAAKLEQERKQKELLAIEKEKRRQARVLERALQKEHQEALAEIALRARAAYSDALLKVRKDPKELWRRW